MTTEKNLAKIPKPSFDSELNTVIVELEKLREKKLSGTVPPHVFFQVKEIFQILESLGSNRIEGNRTTISEYAEKVIAGKSPDSDESMREIANVEDAIDFLEANVKVGTPITRVIISELHKIIVNGLTLPKDGGEGSASAGSYREEHVSVKNSQLKTVPATLIAAESEELFSFINDKYPTQFHLLVIAIAHHRFSVIHPFDNGNGRTVRMLTYAQLLQQGFSVKSGRILNPTAIFCDDRNVYYDMLAKADTGTEEAMLEWCLYVLKGLAREIAKIDKLLDRKYLADTILLPMLARSLENKYITPVEHTLLKYVVASSPSMTIKANDIGKLLSEESSVQRSRIIAKLVGKKMLKPIQKGARIYTISFFANYLFRELTQLLIEHGFVPESLNKK